MKVSRFDIYTFSLPLKRPLTIGNQSLVNRKGLILRLENDHGDVAFGETSPLPGFSRETIQEAQAQLVQLRKALLDKVIPEGLTDARQGFEHWLGPYKLSPSVRFGVESAVIGLYGAYGRLPLFHFLNTSTRDKITINALLAGSLQEVLEKVKTYLEIGYRAFKLKIGRNTISEDIALVRKIRKKIPPWAILRLDANRSWSLKEALAFSDGLSQRGIDYIEEPVRSLSDLEALLAIKDFGLPLALDETLSEITPDTLSSLDSVKAIILKPTLLGLERALNFSDKALDHDKIPVISSSFESGVGLTLLARLAAAINEEDIPTGLDTLEWFDQDLLRSPMEIDQGTLEIGKLLDLHDNIRRESLSGFTHG